MDKYLRDHIAEIYFGNCWEAITGIIWQNGEPWQLFKFEEDVEYAGRTFRCIIISKNIFDPDDLEAVDHSDDVLSEAWPI